MGNAKGKSGRGWGRRGWEDGNFPLFREGRKGKKGRLAVASGSCEGGGGMSSSDERGSPLRGMRGGGVRGEGTRRGNGDRKEDGDSFHREGRKGKEDPPCGGCVEGGVRKREVEDSEGRGGVLGKRGGRGEEERLGETGDEAFFLRGKGIGG